jgi:hypothetical protein
MAGGSAAAGVEELAALLMKEQRNSYGIILPVQQQQPTCDKHNSSSSSGSHPDRPSSRAEDQEAEEGERAVRGGGIYPRCALVNHECIPNVVRMDCFDFVPAQWPAGAERTAVVLRAMHDLPAGTELVQSYFPLNWSYAERQEQAQQVCGPESSWQAPSTWLGGYAMCCCIPARVVVCALCPFAMTGTQCECMASKPVCRLARHTDCSTAQQPVVRVRVWAHLFKVAVCRIVCPVCM